MLSDRSTPRVLVRGEARSGAGKNACPPDDIVRWIDHLRDRGLGDIALVLTDLLKVWGFAGSQILWMLAPFLPNTAITSVATVLESPEMLDQVRTYLAGDSDAGSVKERADD